MCVDPGLTTDSELQACGVAHAPLRAVLRARTFAVQIVEIGTSAPPANRADHVLWPWTRDGKDFAKAVAHPRGGAARPPAGGEHGGALLGGEAAGLAAAGRGVGGRRAAEALEGLAGERPGRRLLTGVAGGDGQRGGCRRAAGLVQIPQIRREARIVQPPAGEPSGELAESRGVYAARVRRGGPHDELGRGLGAGAMRGRERAGCAAAGGHVLHDRQNYRALLVRVQHSQNDSF